MKLRLAGFVRGLFRHADDSEHERHVAPPTPAVPAPEPPPVAAAPVETSFISRTDSTDVVDLPLAQIIAGLPMDLKAKLMNHPQVGQTISVPAETLVSQLAFGAVKITFGDLRHLAPGIFANSGGEHDGRPVTLPLQEVLMRINPALLARRSASKVEVAEEVAGPFDGRGRGVTFTSQPLKAPAATTPPVLFPQAPVARKTTPEPATFSFVQRQVTPAAQPVPFTPPAKPAGNSFSNGNGSNGHGNGHSSNGNGNGNGHAPASNGLPPFKFSVAAASPAPAVSSAPRPEPAQPTPSVPPLMVSIDDLSETWPDGLKHEIMSSNLANASAPLPLSIIEVGLKKGRVTMTWKEIRMLAKPSSAPSSNDSLVLDLPLKVLAPAFLAAQKKMMKSVSKVAVSSEIPNLFFGFPQGSPSAVAESAPAPVQAPIQGQTLVTPRQNDTNFFAQGEMAEPLRLAPAPATDFMNRQMHPKDVVAQAAAMKGVSGAVVSLADGLRVASEVPQDLNPDTIAAFLPQIYERVNQCTRELRMGALNNVSFTVGNVPWKIFRINSIYFAAFGRAGEPLPKSQLAALAAELDRKK